jgi:hypothetical protein
MYKRPEEKRKTLTSVNNYTTFDFNEEDRKQPRISQGKDSEGRTLGCHRKDDGQGQYKSGRGREKDRRTADEYQQDHASETSRQCRFPTEDGREHRPRCGNESEKIEDLNVVGDETFPLSSEL